MRGGLLYGPLVAADGRRKRARIGRLRLLELLFAGDFDPTLRAELPAALKAAREGDTAPLLRLALRSERGAGPTPARYLSDALYTATVCEEGPLPWDRTTPVNARPAAAEANVRALPVTTLGPFDRTTVLFGSASLPALQPLAHRARRSTVARRALPRRPHARARRRGRPAHPARVRAPGRVRGSRGRRWSPCPRWATRC